MRNPKSLQIPIYHITLVLLDSWLTLTFQKFLSHIYIFFYKILSEMRKGCCALTPILVEHAEPWSEKAHLIQIKCIAHSLAPIQSGNYSAGPEFSSTLYIKHNSATSCSPTFCCLLNRQQNDKTDQRRVICQHNQ